MPKKLFFISTIIFLITTGLGCKSISQEEQEASKPLTLNYWRVYDDSDSFTEIIAAYKALHPNITVNYRKLRPEEFQTELLNALAEDRGPDMFSIQNTWLTAYQSKIAPLPAALKVAFISTEGTYQKKTVVNIKTVVTPTVKQIQDQYVATVGANVIRSDIDAQTQKPNKAIFGLPFSVDTIALFYNKDLLDAAGIPEPPKTWEDFQKDVKLLTRLSSDNKILQAGAALGLGKNVTRTVDILSLLMMQNGATMANEAGFPSFQQMPVGANLPATPGAQALQFYTDFADPTKEVYTWNAEMPESLDAFSRGQAAFFFGYAYHLPYIRARAPKLNFNVVSAPQINVGSPVNFASFWVETVSKKTKHLNEAWDFILFASKTENVVKYLNKVKKPPALRSLVTNQAEDPDLQPFASQLLTAKSWYRGRDTALAEQYFQGMIDEVFKPSAINDTQVYQRAVNNAANKIGQTF